jgi:hypothetical protein
MKEFFCFDGEDITLHDTEQAAMAEANAALERYRDMSPDGWPSEVDQVCYGKLTEMQAASQVNRQEKCKLGPDDAPCEDDWCDRPHEFEYTCDYQLKPAKAYATADRAQAIGILQEVNRQFLHPLGWCLAVVRESESGNVCGVELRHFNDPDGYAFDDLTDDDAKAKAEAVAALQVKMQAPRLASVGFFIQPIGSKLP